MGVVAAMTSRSLAHNRSPEEGFHRCWYPVCLARELEVGVPLGRDLLGTRLVAWRAPDTGKPVVQGAWCPHLGADLSLGQIVEGQLRCPYHHWSFDGSGACTRIASGDKIPPAARIFTYPAVEAWGLIWMFNGETADYPVPGIPDADEGTIAFEAHERPRAPFDGWIAVSNGVDFQHLQTLHGLPTSALPDEVTVDGCGMEYEVESPFHMQHGRITGTNCFAQHLRIGPREMFMLFTSAPIEPGWSTGHFVVGVPKGEEERLPEVRAMAERLQAEDAPVLRSIRFRRGLLTASDRHLARYLRYVDSFPTFLPPEG
jgi:phenylpropionate dioxygenase-like ring-hydroxylating dioxygenase large terminal subunit